MFWYTQRALYKLEQSPLLKYKILYWVTKYLTYSEGARDAYASKKLGRVAFPQTFDYQ